MRTYRFQSFGISWYKSWVGPDANWPATVWEDLGIGDTAMAGMDCCLWDAGTSNSRGNYFENNPAERAQRAQLGVAQRSVKHAIFGAPKGSRKLGFTLALLGLVLCMGTPRSASAAPILYDVTGGSVSITVLVGGLVVGSTVSPGLSGSLTLDSAAQTMDSLNLVLDPNISLSLSSSYGGYNEITIEEASLTSDVGFGAIMPPSSGSSSYTVFVGPLTVNGAWGATDTSGTNPPASGVPITYPVPALSAVVNTSPLVSIVGVTLNALDGATYGEASDLTVLANFSVNSVVLIPEPGTALLVGSGLLILAARRRRLG